MVDITKDELWDRTYEDIHREVHWRPVKKRNKFLSTTLIILTILIITNTVLIYNFFRLLNTL